MPIWSYRAILSLARSRSVDTACAGRMLQGLVRREHSLIEMRVAEENRRGAPIVSATVMVSIEATIAHLRSEIERVAREIEQLFDDYPTLRRQRELSTA